MSTRRVFLALPLLIVTTAVAQTHTVRGKVEDVQGTANQFFLDCTRIPLVSNTLDLNALVGQQLVMQVQQMGGFASLNVISATPATKIFDMGNLRIGRAERWQVLGNPGAQTFTFVNHIDGTGFLPLGAAGSWLLGAGAQPIMSGTVNGLGVFEFRFTMPNIPSLIGQTFSAQAIILDNSQFTLTNPDCKDVRT